MFNALKSKILQAPYLTVVDLINQSVELELHVGAS